MEHNDAVQLQAVEKYILGELSPAIRDEFEDHYFDCAVCSFNLRTGVAFAAGTRQFFAETGARAGATAPKPGWFSWLKPMVAIPVMAALLLIVGYQYVTNSQQTSEVQAWYSLNDASAHGSAGTRIETRRGSGFHLMFDIGDVPQPSDKTLFVQVQDFKGTIVLRRIIPAGISQKSVILDLPPNFKEGDYKVVVFDHSSSTVPVLQLPFSVAFSS